MSTKSNGTKRVVGLDCHPDTFTAALVSGPTPAAALVEKVFNKVPLGRLESWAAKNTTAEDTIVIEASGNTFNVVRRLAAEGRTARVVESCQMGKLKEAHANNDKISAVRLGKAYLAGTAKEVWVPDLKTQERRDMFHAHRKAVKRLTQARNSLLSYLSDNGVRLPKGTALTGPEAQATLRAVHSWSVHQWQVIERSLLNVRHADEQRRYWRSLIAQEVLTDPDLLSLVRLCGVREMVAFALGAFIGDIQRFANPKKLVKYVGLNPAFGHGRKDLRCLLIEGAQAILRSSQAPLAQWGRRLLARKGSKNLVVAALARKLTVSVWYLMSGRWSALEEVEPRLVAKVGKMITEMGETGLKTLGKTRKAFREGVYQALKTGRTYVLDPNKKLQPIPAPAQATSTAYEYGLR